MRFRRPRRTNYSLIGARLRRRLVRRLLIGGLAIALALGGTVAVSDVHRIDVAILTLLRVEAEQMVPHLPSNLDSLDHASSADVEFRLQSLLGLRSGRPGGHFIAARLFDQSHRLVAESFDPAAATLDARRWLPAGDALSEDGSWYGERLVSSHLLLPSAVTLRRADGQPIGTFEGVYLLPWGTLANVAAGGLKTSGLVIVIVAATTALLYPVIASLNEGLIMASADLLEANLTVLTALGSAVAKRDSTTNSHNFRVVLISVRLAESLDLSSGRIRALIKGAFLHDVGKLAIPDAILLKPERLTVDEFEVMKGHVAHGLDIIKKFGWLSDAADVVGCHHEWYDGSGYPGGLAGDAIPLAARIFAVADVFDALTARRPYKEPFSLAKTRASLEQGRGTHFDPAILDVFLTMAPALYAELAGREDPGLECELHAVTHRHFAALVHHGFPVN
jgi:HD-GYP domain-containing protein (c-di-GMP phosphodiesterase class II)